MTIRSGALHFDDVTDRMTDVFQIMVCLVQLQIQSRCKEWYKWIKNPAKKWKNEEKICQQQKKHVMLTRIRELKRCHHTFLEDINISWHFCIAKRFVWITAFIVLAYYFLQSVEMKICYSINLIFIFL